MSHPYHILIAESFKGVRELLVRAIGKDFPNATFSVATDGLHAYQIVMQQGADLLIVSSQLNRLNGPDLIRTLRSQQSTIPILLLSSDPALAAVAAQIGADRFLLKPFTLRELHQIVQALLP